MKNNLTILITSIGGLTSPDIIRAYKENGQYSTRIIGVDAFQFPAGLSFVDIFYKVPDSGDEEFFIRTIEEIVLKEKVDVVVPCGNEDNLVLSKYKRNISAKIMVGEHSNLLFAYDKGFVYKRLQEDMSEYCPKFYVVKDYTSFIEAINSLDFPRKKIVLKPRHGRGGRGVYIINGELSFSEIFSMKPTQEYPFDFFNLLLKKEQKFEELIVMEYLSQPFYSVYSLCKDGKNIISLTHVREWGNASQTFRGLAYYDEKIESIATDLIQKFQLTYTCNMEFGTSQDGKIILFDLNPRIGASSGIDRDIGLNFPYLALKLLLDEDIYIDKTLFMGQRKFLRFFDYVWMP